MARQASNALQAASTASFTSSAPERGNTPSTSPEAGSMFSRVPPLRAGTQRPPIQFW